MGGQRRSEGGNCRPAGYRLRSATAVRVPRPLAALVLLGLGLVARAADPPTPDDGLLEFLGRGDDEKTALKDWAGDGTTTAPQEPGGQADVKPAPPIKPAAPAGGADKPS